MPDHVEGLLRELSPQVLGAVVRRFGHFDLAEDAVQDALIAATTHWPDDGVPDNPRAWLITVAARRLTDLLRSEQARRRREDTVALLTPIDEWTAPGADRATPEDDTLILLFMCCHPSLSTASQIALTLRAVGGLSTAEIARAFLVPESAMTRRISRAKQTIKESGIPFAMPPLSQARDRLVAVLRVLYLIFKEGYAATSGASLHRSDLATEAIRLARLLHRLLPDEPEVTGLLALMLLTDARRLARTTSDGSLVPMDEQDRSRWNAEYISEGVALVEGALRRGRPGPYQVQAAIAALHDEAPTSEDTDWPQIVALYDVLAELDPSPVVLLNRAVAIAMAQGAHTGLALLDDLQADKRIAADHRLFAARAHLLELSGDRAAAREWYQLAARKALTLPQQRYLQSRASRLAG